jgi:hypothetical protein
VLTPAAAAEELGVAIRRAEARRRNDTAAPAKADADGAEEVVHGATLFGVLLYHAELQPRVELVGVEPTTFGLPTRIPHLTTW